MGPKITYLLGGSLLKVYNEILIQLVLDGYLEAKLFQIFWMTMKVREVGHQNFFGVRWFCEKIFLATTKNFDL